ncbi:unnamed protein product [Spirodela intermedia]|uniref:Glucosidase II beta subunit N-terminal domain-containing protein n=1 Tax=Spirodela intermedia TaxID=51605 RepID=A0A7I8KXK4_SPIIN|nr:unnamed protein product [Spirodela intermedia]
MALASRWRFRLPIPCFLVVVVLGCSISFLGTSSLSDAPSLFLGVAPQDEEYFAAERIACRDGSKSFRRDRLNDGFCDCPDGTDEPGTSACPEGRFYCKNVGDKPILLFSSRVNDHICDCCDGSDENDGSITCPNTCSLDADIIKQSATHDLKGRKMTQNDSGVYRKRVNLDDLILRQTELRVAAFVEFFLAVCGITFCFIRQRNKSRTRNRRQRS